MHGQARPGSIAVARFSRVSENLTQCSLLIEGPLFHALAMLSMCKNSNLPCIIPPEADPVSCSKDFLE